MANHASALKRARQSEKRNLRNKARKSEIRSVVRSLLEIIDAGNREAAQDLFRKAQKLISKAVTGGSLHKSTASRKISRLAARVNGID